MVSKYGKYSSEQIKSVKTSLQKSIFFLLLYVDPATKSEYPDIDVDSAFRNIQNKLGGLNDLLFQPPEIVTVMSYLERAWRLYNSEDFSFKLYRKLILDAGAEIMKMQPDPGMVKVGD